MSLVQTVLGLALVGAVSGSSADTAHGLTRGLNELDGVKMLLLAA